MSVKRFSILSLSALLLTSSAIANLSIAKLSPAVALPPPEDIPEEVLRTEVITEARSPVDGESMTAEEYAEYQAEQEAIARNPPANVSPELRRLITLLRLRYGLRRIFPFIP